MAKTTNDHPVKLPIATIKTPSDLQPRVTMNGDVIQEYAGLLRADDKFDLPAVIVFHDGESYWLADGFHRHGAYRLAYRGEVPAIVFKGTRRDALAYSLSANATHGLRRSNADKRRAVETALKDEEWGKRSDNELAKLCAVDHKTVAAVRSSLGNFPSEGATEPSPSRTYQNKHGTRTKMKTGRIGKGRKQGKGKAQETKGYPKPVPFAEREGEPLEPHAMLAIVRPMIKEMQAELRRTIASMSTGLLVERLAQIEWALNRLRC